MFQRQCQGFLKELQTPYTCNARTCLIWSVYNSQFGQDNELTVSLRSMDAPYRVGDTFPCCTPDAPYRVGHTFPCCTPGARVLYEDEVYLVCVIYYWEKAFVWRQYAHFRRCSEISTPSRGNIVAPSMILRVLFLSALPGSTVKLRNVRTIVIFPSSCASRKPTHVRGPLPNGIHANGCRFALFSALNLKYIRIMIST